MEEKKARQPFGSPGGKHYSAGKIIEKFPEHKVYVEPYAGAAAVYFKKQPSDKEVLNDKDSMIGFAFRFIRDMTPEQYKILIKKDWVKSQSGFDRAKAMIPKNDIEKFYRFYYMKKASFGAGSLSYNNMSTGESVGVDILQKSQDRLKKTKITGGQDAIPLIDKHDSKDTLFYLDPPYPDRDFVGATFKPWTEKDLAELVARLKTIKGKFALSLGKEHAKLLPKNWNIDKIPVLNILATNGTKAREHSGLLQSKRYEILATNYKKPKNRINMPRMTSIRRK